MSQLRVLATSDVHIGSYGSAVDASGLNLGMKSGDRVRQFIVDYATEVQPDLFLFVGDLYKTAIGKPTQTEQWRATEWFHSLCAICPVVAKAGNHDVGEEYRADGVHALQIFSAMNLRLTVLPHPDQWSVINVDGIRIGLYHGMLSGVKLQSGLMSDSVSTALPAIWDAPKADLYLLGDIHHRQFLSKNAAYCGAPDRLNFGEENEVPTFWDLTITKEPGKEAVVDWQAIETPARKFITLTEESQVETVDVRDATVRFEGELKRYTHGELVALLKSRGAVEVPNVADTSEFDEAPSIYTSFDPQASYAIWLDVQTGVSKEDKAVSQNLLAELLG